MFIFLFLPAITFAQEEEGIVEDEIIEDETSEIVEEEEVDDDEVGTEINFRLSPNFGLSFQSISASSDDETIEVQWLAGVQSQLNIVNPSWQLAASLFLKYGQLHSKGEYPVKSQDNLIVSIMPSIYLWDAINLKLFFETAGHTTMGKGDIDGYPTKFLDPLFLYQTLFIGQEFYSASEEGTYEFNVLYGVGYAVQQTIATDYVLEENRDFEIGPDNPLSNIQDNLVFESGFSAIFKLNYTTYFTEDFSFYSSISTAALTQSEFVDDIENATVNNVLSAGLQYNFITIDYTSVLYYNRLLSVRRQLDQSLALGIRFDI